MKTCSEMLREAREDKGLTFQEVALSTNINVPILKALESADFTVLPQTYVRGFIKTYARQLGLDPVEVLKTFDAQQKAIEEVSASPGGAERKRPRSFAWRRWGFFAGAVVLLCIALLLSRRQGAKESEQILNMDKEDVLLSQTDTEPPRSSMPGEVAAIRVKSDSLRMVLPDSVPSVSGEEDTAESPGDSLSELPDSGAAVDRERAQGPAASVPQAAIKLTLRAQAVSDTWMQVLSDGVPVYEGLLRAGSTIGWDADSLFALKMSKAGGVRLNLNGQSLGDLGPVNAVVSSLVLSREGIVKKVLK